MFLEKLEIQGFKSFANKNTLVFPGMLDKERRGITAIVGPNGSGKSNIADAVRWVLGEQSMKQLRGKKSEDVIFSGSDKKGKLGMAEVSLYLNNENSGGRDVSIDYSQIILTRRLYRDGASDYLLNNARARLADIQILLAKAKFGQKTYSVIGQGMVEGFLNTSLAERKEFFDEATGVKQFQIKRDESLNKLRLSYENITQAEMLLSEIDPRLKSLTRQVNKLKRREEVETETKDLQLAYYGKSWHEINNKFSQTSKRFLELDKIKIEKDKKLETLNRKLEQMEKEGGTNDDFSNFEKELSLTQSRKDRLTKEFAKLDAQRELKFEASGQFDLSWLSSKKEEIEKEIKKIGTETKNLEGEIKQTREEKEKFIKEKESISAGISRANTELQTPGEAQAGNKIEKIKISIRGLLAKLAAAGAEEDPGKIKKIISEIKEGLEKLLIISEKEEGIDTTRIAKAQNELTRLMRSQEETFEKINEKSLSISSATERKKLLEEKLKQLKNESNSIGEKLKQHQGGFNMGEQQQARENLKDELNGIEKDERAIKEKIVSLGEKESAKRALIFEAQKNIQFLQNEINLLAGQLNEIKIESTRYETRLEDLETEIRHELGDLKKIRETNPAGEIDSEAIWGKINNLKRQLDQIGGIDPEIEKEYLETKGRFDFLSGQTKDLSEAIKSLEKIIKELDLTIKERFDKEFKLISQKFEEYFKILFDGGQAKIIKVLAEEELEEKNNESGPAKIETGEEGGAKKENTDLKRIKYLQKFNATGLAGIEIQATPPGKKIKSISMLSGGERALTAIALICAIISANPSPFVVLDEVDAALDEANSERLAKILDDLSYKTQFIVITHNRASMRRANILYGVTMQDDGMSKLLSIKLDEAENKAR
jgi:chromosome segregation protein